jgi:hypothetical protein
MPRAHSLPPGAATNSRMSRNPFAEAFHFGVTGPSVVRFGAADSEVAPQWLTLVACCRLP